MQSDTPPGKRPAPPERPTAQPRPVPAPDMQPEDAGTPASGQDAGRRGTAGEPPLKQAGKTGDESGRR